METFKELTTKKINWLMDLMIKHPVASLLIPIAKMFQASLIKQLNLEPEVIYRRAVEARTHLNEIIERYELEQALNKAIKK